MCEDNIEIGVTEITNNILVSATPTDQIIDINVTETTEDVTLNITPSVVEVNIDVTQELITEIVTVDAETCVNIVDVTVTDATDNVTLNITPSIVEVNINRNEGGGASVWGGITGTLSDQTDLQAALNAKQNALGYTPVPQTRTLTINGVTYDLSANRSWTVAGGLSGSGTTNYLSKWTGASSLGNSLVYDDGTNVMIGTTTSLYKLTVNTASGVNFGVGRTSVFSTNDSVFLNSTDNSYSAIPFTLNASHIGLYIGYSEAMRIDVSKNVLIGTTTGVTGGGLLQVNGIINSGEYGLYGGYLKLDTTPTTTPTSVGTLSWNDTDGTADLKLKGGNVTLQIGQEQLVRVVNKTGATLNEADFRVVRVRSVAEGGAQGQRLAVVLAQANNDANSATTIGLVTENISDNQEGFITTFGNVSEIDTTGAKSYGGLETWVDGDMLYLSPTYAGYLTNVKPVAPQHMVIVGYVVYAHAIHGKIFVKVDNGYELDELHNVLITSPSNGQALVYDSANSVWKNSTISAGGIGGSGTTNYISKWSSSSALTNSLLFDNGTNVGIGTTSPRAKLDIATGYAYAGGFWTVNESLGGGFYFGDLDTGASYAFIGGVGNTGASSYLTFYTNATEKMRILSNGNIGIGITSPDKKLEVYSSYSGNYTAQLKLFGSSSISGRALYLGSFANTGYITMGGTFANGWTTDTTTAMAAIYMDSNSADSSIAFATTTTNNSAPTERMRIKSSGVINFANVPTSAAGLSSGDVYRIGAALMIV